MVAKRDFASRLNQLMQERQMTVREAALQAGVATSTVQNWRSGHLPTDFSAIRRLAQALDFSFSFLLTGEDDCRPRSRTPSITECFVDDGVLFDGYARVTIHKLSPVGEK
jgi:transcriptional regulator with XRE-family HTH domain